MQMKPSRGDSGAQATFPLPCTPALLQHLPMEPEAEQQTSHRNSPVPLAEHLSTCPKARQPVLPGSSPQTPAEQPKNEAHGPTRREPLKTMQRSGPDPQAQSSTATGWTGPAQGGVTSCPWAASWLHPVTAPVSENPSAASRNSPFWPVSTHLPLLLPGQESPVGQPRSRNAHSALAMAEEDVTLLFSTRSRSHKPRGPSGGLRSRPPDTRTFLAFVKCPPLFFPHFYSAMISFLQLLITPLLQWLN